MPSDAASGQGHLPLDGVPEQSADAPAASEDAFDGALWNDDFADVLADPATTNWFSAEIESVNASDWDVDTAQIWGDDGGDGADDGGGTEGLDFSL